MKVKGAALKSSIKYLMKNFHPEEVDRVMDSLPEDHREILFKPILPSAWYEAELLYGLMHTMASQSTLKSEDLFHKMGKQSCDDGATTVYRVFFKLGSPSFIVKRAAQVWNKYYDEGTMEVVQATPHMAHLRLTEVHFPDEAMCIRVRGWMERAIELCGGNVLSIEHFSCVNRGGESCDWKAVWS